MLYEVITDRLTASGLTSTDPEIVSIDNDIYTATDNIRSIALEGFAAIGTALTNSTENLRKEATASIIKARISSFILLFVIIVGSIV